MFVSSLAAHAQGSDKVAAEALFSEGRRLMAEGRIAEACQKFEASQKMDPGVGTSLNLAECYERSGKTASAWAQFREAVSLARATGSADREQLARERAEALEQRLARLTISLAGTAPSGLEVRRDGARLDPAELGIAIPVDPGSHAVTASAPGRAAYSTTVDVTGDGALVNVEIPELPPEAVSPPPPQSTVSTQLDSGTTSSSGGSQKALAAVALGLGGAGLIVGGVFGFKASSSWDDAKAECSDYPYGCGPEGKSLEDDARSQALLSTIGFGAGIALVATGAVLWFTAGSSSDAPTVGLGPTGASVRGSF
ncbi:MAG: hypothetical protein M3020_03115 [Myxococcota bacterium]|nr:hypothetical protein [Myxococcota bacterium]